MERTGEGNTALTSPVFDAAIVGAGPVGQFCALAIAQFGARVLLLEARNRDATLHDERTLALSWHTWLLLQRVGAIHAMREQVTPITTIHVSQSGQIGRTVLSAQESGIPALGYIASYSALQRALNQSIDAHATVRYETAVNALREEEHMVHIAHGNSSSRARVVLVAEGGGRLLSSLGFHAEEKQYDVNALVAQVSTDRSHNGVAYERFCHAGPIALLPRENNYALVWTATQEQTQNLVSANEQQFLEQLQITFGWRAGKFTAASHRGQYPLVLKQVRDRSRHRIALLGNAAQTLHPVAGQGLNLGLRDAWTAAQHVKNMLQVSGASLKNFSAERRLDRDVTVRFTDGLAEVFTKSWPGFSIVRAFALEALDISPVARRAFSRAMSIGINL